MTPKGLKRRAIKRKIGHEKPEYITPEKKEKGGPYSQTKTYKYFEGHITPEVADKLPSTNVVCWYNDHILTLPICAIKKFWQLQSYCKRCSLFQDDEHTKKLQALIEEWELDDLEKENP